MKTRILSLKKIKKRIKKLHGDSIKIKDETYQGVARKAMFVDSEYGEWETFVVCILRGCSHPKRKGLNISKALTISASEISKRIAIKHKNFVSMDETTYINSNLKAKFIDKLGNEWWACPASVLKGYLSQKLASKNKTTTLEDLKSKISKIHGDTITIDETTYINTKKKARFIDKEYGEWWSMPITVLTGRGHKKRGISKKRETCLKLYGYTSVGQVPEFALKAARSNNKSCIKLHWKTGEELICQSGWEPKVVDYLNKNKIEYSWQSRTFTMPNGKTYRPDLFLINENKWIEIKGYFREYSKNKWEWFHKTYPNSELWQKEKLKEIGIL